jgi:hypothetical protein
MQNEGLTIDLAWGVTDAFNKVNPMVLDIQCNGIVHPVIENGIFSSYVVIITNILN